MNSVLGVEIANETFCTKHLFCHVEYFCVLSGVFSLTFYSLMQVSRMAEITNHVKYYLYVLSPHRIKYYVCVVCLHIMLGMISMFYVTTERLPTNS